MKNKSFMIMYLLSILCSCKSSVTDIPSVILPTDVPVKQDSSESEELTLPTSGNIEIFLPIDEEDDRKDEAEISELPPTTEENSEPIETTETPS